MSSKKTLMFKMENKLLRVNLFFILDPRRALPYVDEVVCFAIMYALHLFYYHGLGFLRQVSRHHS